MKNKINIGIGFVTGRPNVCNVINNTYNKMIEQFKMMENEVELTIFILYDLNYEYVDRDDFYHLTFDVYENIKIEYITPENIQEMKKELINKRKINNREAELFFGNGHAKGRNSLMYYALKKKMDYLLFWDDDEYPVACKRNEETKEISWEEQNNISTHYNYIQNADVTVGYHCGYISPIPYIELTKEIDEELFKDFIEAVSNDIITYESIKEKNKKYNGVTYANEKILNNKENSSYEIEMENGGKWVAGSTLCLNLKNINKIPAFYNPEGARGEDTFFSTMLKKSKVLRVPVYHFHDGFLKYKNILENKYPKTLRKVKFNEDEISNRFFKAARGWIKYKPLFVYLTQKKQYKNKMKEIYSKLELSIPELNKLFKDKDFEILLEDLTYADENIKKSYKDYKKTNKVWNKLKKLI